MSNDIYLFEYGDKKTLDFSSKDFEELEICLEKLWEDRDRNEYFRNNDNISTQQIIQFFHKDRQVRAQKYVGIIQYKKQKLNIIPKIFNETSEDNINIEKINLHLLWWLSYCKKIKFPKLENGLDNIKSDIFEILIYVFSKYTREVIETSLFRRYEDVNNELQYVKGKIDIKKYINNNLTKGNWHKIYCRYNKLALDNEFNRVIKYVASLLVNKTKNEESKKYLREILFIFSDVSDKNYNTFNFNKIKFNPLFKEYKLIKNYCEIFLKNLVTNNNKSKNDFFAFLIPTDYLYEDFANGFLERELNEEFETKYQKKYIIDTDENFNLSPDFIIKNINNGHKLIIDTKYKKIGNNDEDFKEKIKNFDLYQMISYSVATNINDVILLYPYTENEEYVVDQNFNLTIEQEILNKKIKIKIRKIPMIKNNLWYSSNKSLQEHFSEFTENLKDHLLKMFLAS